MMFLLGSVHEQVGQGNKALWEQSSREQFQVPLVTVASEALLSGPALSGEINELLNGFLSLPDL